MLTLKVGISDPDLPGSDPARWRVAKPAAGEQIVGWMREIGWGGVERRPTAFKTGQDIIVVVVRT
jgi:hypothetical protein